MTKFVPFTVHVRVVPVRGKRLEYVRDLQKLSTKVYEELLLDSDLKIATPGGGQSVSSGGTDGGGLSNYAAGTAIKPQIGQNPAQLQITGFITSTSANGQLHPDETTIHCGASVSGAGGAHGWQAGPNAEVDTLAKSLKTKFNNAITSAIGTGDWNVFRIDLAGVVYGDRGYSFPR